MEPTPQTVAHEQRSSISIARGQAGKVGWEIKVYSHDPLTEALIDNAVLAFRLTESQFDGSVGTEAADLHADDLADQLAASVEALRAQGRGAE